MKDSISKYIGQNIKELREENQISRINMAMELGYSQANYGKIENGKQQLTCQGLITLCKYFSCEPERIVYGEKENIVNLFPDYFSGYSEYEKRRLLRMFYLLLNCQKIKTNASFHKFFGSDILNIIPLDEENILPYVLEYERKAKDLTKRKMIAFLGISKNKYYALLDGEPLSGIDMLIRLHQKLEYDMGFLLFNRVNPALFLSALGETWNSQVQNLLERQLELCSAMDKLSDRIHTSYGTEE